VTDPENGANWFSLLETYRKRLDPTRYRSGSILRVVTCLLES
jgi:hypothetical protein